MAIQMQLLILKLELLLVLLKFALHIRYLLILLIAILGYEVLTTYLHIAQLFTLAAIASPRSLSEFSLFPCL